MSHDDLDYATPEGGRRPTRSGSQGYPRGDSLGGLTGILLTQRMATSPEPVELVTDFWAAAYAAIDA